MHRPESELNRYNEQDMGFIGMLYEMAASIYNRLRNMVLAAFGFARRDVGGSGDMSPRDVDDRSWMARLGRFLFNSLDEDSSSSSAASDSTAGERKPREGGPRGTRGRRGSVDGGLEPCPSTTVTVGSSVPSGTNLYERESDIEYYYPNPAFVVEGPPSEEETVIVHRSVSQNLKK